MMLPNKAVDPTVHREIVGLQYEGSRISLSGRVG